MGDADGDPSHARPVRVAGRYALYGTIAVGGMATVHFGRLRGPVGFARTVAIKRLHPQYASDPEFVNMFVDEARVAARLRHPNVVPIIDVVATKDDLLLVMDYVPGESLSRLLRQASERGTRPPLGVLSAIMTGVLHGLHAAHEATDERGKPLELVHRDVSPQNIVVGTDGHARLLDFGVAKAIGRAQITRDSQIKGKLAYMAREQVTGGVVTRSADVYAAAVVLWEALTSRRLFTGDNDGEVLERVLMGLVSPPSKFAPEATQALDELTLRGLARNPAERFASAEDMARALESAVPPALPSAVAAWVTDVAGDALKARARTVLQIESGSTDDEAGATAVEETLHVDATSAGETVASQVSSISVSKSAPVRSTPREERRRRTTVAVAALVTVFVATAGVVVLGRLGSAGRHDRESSAPGSAPIATSPPAAGPGESASSSALGESVPSPTVIVSSLNASAASASPLSGPVERRPSSRPIPTTRTTSPKGRCNPPYVVDATGKVTFKRECLH